MKHSFQSLTKVSQAYVLYNRDTYFTMNFDDVFMWIGYGILGFVILWFLMEKCWKCTQRLLRPDEDIEIYIPSTCSTSSSFTFLATNKPGYGIPDHINDGLSDFDNSILFDQPMMLCNENPYCKQHADRGQTSPELIVRRSSSSVIGRIQRDNINYDTQVYMKPMPNASTQQSDGRNKISLDLDQKEECQEVPSVSNTVNINDNTAIVEHTETNCNSTPQSYERNYDYLNTHYEVVAEV